jgi:hypothetical protein
MTDTKQTWAEVGDRFERLALKLKLHFEQAGAGKEAEEALERMGVAVRQAFDALGTASRDPAVRNELDELGSALGDAFGSSFAEVSERLQRCFTEGRTPPDGAE